MHAAILRTALVFFAFFIFMNAPSARAAEVEAAGDGTVRLKEQNVWEKTGVTVSLEALAFGDAWREAYRNPGTPVPVKTRIERETNGLLSIVTRTTIDKAVLYDEKGKRILLVTDAGAKTETKFNWFLLFAGIAACAMVISNVLYARRQSFFDAATFAAAAFAAAFAAEEEEVTYRIASGIFYGALALSVILFYVSV